jgi:uncharacterized protein DUF5916/cellulose/xylan binding protein with CBM9 domain
MVPPSSCRAVQGLGGGATAIVMLALAAGASAEERAPDPVTLHRATGAITVDGDLSDAGWAGATVVDRFYETQPGDNAVPAVKTTAWLTYDERYFYIALKCDDPQPGRIRAPYVERDNVIGTDDNVAIFLDTRNDRRSAIELRVNPRGIQADGIYNDANSNEDFSPDFFYDSAARITAEGWQAELRIPFSTLRYPSAPAQEWGIMIWRNYPREFRYAYYSSPQSRGTNCYVCHLAPLLGLAGLPSSSRLLLVPYVTGQHVARAESPGRPLGKGDATADAGLDLKWTPTADTAIDATLNPDFSQVEGDVAQIAVNERFALFFPEKRPFFLEGVDLFDSPIQAVYTRTITAPRGGLRVTGKAGSSSYTALLSEDDGGGLVVLPGPAASSFAPQDFKSWVGIARLRHDLGHSFVGAVFTGRAIEGGGHNVVFGPDFQWRSSKDSVTAQALWTDTETPDRPELAEVWDGRRLSGAALRATWDHNTQHVGWNLDYRDFADGFRDDQGFVPQVGYRQGGATAGYTFYPTGFLRLVRPFVHAERAEDRAGALVNQRIYPALFLSGRKNLNAELDLDFDRVRTGGLVLPRTQLTYFVQLDPSRRLPRISVNGFVGEDVDIANGRVGRGASVQATATFRPDPHLSLEAITARRWLNVAPGVELDRQRLFTAQIQRLKGTFSLSARMFLRVIGQYVSTRNDAALFLVPTAPHEAGFSGSALLSYRVNWQTALFFGYGDERALTDLDRLGRTESQVFLKISYAIQR